MKIARVAVDVPLAHLDRFFDYAIPDAMADDAVVGARVRVRFAGRQVTGFIVDLPTTTEVEGKLVPLTKVVSNEPVLLPAQVDLVRRVADHYAGVFADVVRLAVPPRHAATEAAERKPWPAPEISTMPSGGLLTYRHGETFLTRLSAGEALRAHWLVTPAHPSGWLDGIAQAVVAALRAGRGVIVLVPDRKDLTRVSDGLAAVLGRGSIAELHADLGPAARYRNYLALSRGDARVVVGTRAAVFAPVHDLGLIVVVDEGDDLYAELRAPYPHARDVAALRASTQNAGLLFVSHARSVEVQRWVERGWLVSIEADIADRRRASALVRVADESVDRLPRLAFETIRAGLASGPVLVQVPRGGYLVALTCQQCRTPVRCQECHGPVQGRRTDQGRELTCGWCGRHIVRWACDVCGGHELRAPLVGSTRTAEELGRAFPGYRLVDSSGDNVKASVGDQPALVVATPGGEPVAEHGYAAVVLLDASMPLSRADLRASEEAVRRWFNVLALVVGADEGGTMCIVGPSDDMAVQALVRFDPAGFATRELAQRVAAGLPPASRFIEVSGDPAGVDDLLMLAELPDGVVRLGPIEKIADGEVEHRWLLHVPLAVATATTAGLKAALGVRSARKSPGAARVHVDPLGVL